MQERVSRLAILALILVILGSAKLSFNIGRGPLGLDGSNYFQIARNVAEGRGLVTNISLYHLAYKTLPARSSQTYPLWPLILGYSGRALGMFRAADLVSKLFYFLALITCYFAANAIAVGAIGREEVDSRWPLLDFGHVAVLLLGTNGMFFVATSLPYTEGLSFTLMFASIAMLGVSRAGFATGAAAGILGGLAFLTRTQMILVTPSLCVCLIWIALTDRRFIRAAAGCTFTGFVSLLFWYFDIYRTHTERADVPGFRVWVETKTASGFLLDRLHGVAASFNPGSGLSYFFLWGPVAALPLLAAGWWLARSRRIGWKPSPEQLPMLAAGVAGILFWAILYNYHGTFMLPWLFGYRHGLPYFLLILVALPYLVAAPSRAMRGVTALCVVATLVVGVSRVATFVTTRQPSGPSVAEEQLSAWLEQQPTPPTLLTTNPQILSTWSHAYFHWLLCTDESAQTRALLEKLPIDYLVVYDSQRDCTANRGLGDLLVVSHAFGEGPGRIWLLGRRSATASNRLLSEAR
jgi:hypothetical protein